MLKDSKKYAATGGFSVRPGLHAVFLVCASRTADPPRISRVKLSERPLGSIQHYGINVTIRKCWLVKFRRGGVAALGRTRQLNFPATFKNFAPGRVRLLHNAPRHFLRSRDATSAVEFALIGLPFLAILFAALQTAILLMAQEELETAVEKSARLVLTGQALNNGMTQAQFTSNVCGNLPALFNCNNLMVNMQTADSFADADPAAPALTYGSNGQVNNTWSYQPGNPGSIVVLQVMYQWPVFGSLLGFNLSNLPNGKHLLIATSVFKDEP
jgi:Flp pilus assembly protein TadG